MGLMGRIYVKAGNISAFLHRCIKIDGILCGTICFLQVLSSLDAFVLIYSPWGIHFFNVELVNRKKNCCIYNTDKLYSQLYNTAV